MMKTYLEQNTDSHVLGKSVLLDVKLSLLLDDYQPGFLFMCGTVYGT